MRKAISAPAYIGITLLVLAIGFGTFYLWPRPSIELAFAASPLLGSGPVTGDQLVRTQNIIASRLANMAVSQYSARIVGSNRIVADITTNTDQQALASTLMQRGFIEVLDADNTCPSMGSQAGATVITSTEPIAATDTYTTLITGEDVDPRSVQNGIDPLFGAPQVSFDLKGDPVKHMQAFTTSQRDVNSVVALDKQVVACFKLPYSIDSKQIVVSGLASKAAARELSFFLKSGALPVQLNSAAP
jgi:preprotein translocase subunit SecD